MSQAPQSDQGLGTSPRTQPSNRGVIIWSVAASLLLVGSGVVRAVQSGRYAEDRNYLVECPFPLENIPKAVDGWHVLKGSETVLDPLTTRITGSTDHIIRTYVDEATGVLLSVLVLFGPAEPVMPHTPQICYPSSGFQPVGETLDLDVEIPDGKAAQFRSSIFAKSGGRSILRQGVYHSFLLDGNWSPAIATRKFPRKNPGIFKVQIQRRVADGEKRGGTEPIEDFIKKLLPILDTMIRDSNAAKPASVATR